MMLMGDCGKKSLIINTNLVTLTYVAAILEIDPPFGKGYYGQLRLLS
jgi:hypothetical protein